MALYLINTNNAHHIHEINHDPLMIAHEHVKDISRIFIFHLK